MMIDRVDNSKPLLIVISAPSGGGKTTLCDQLLAGHSDIVRAITCTTRSPRAGEEDGVHYHFLSKKSFLEKVTADQFLEHASVYENLYGTLKSEVMEKLKLGNHVLLNIDVQGARSVRTAATKDSSLSERLVTVFLTPPSAADLERRLRKRASETPETLVRRLNHASTEVSEWTQFDYLIISTSIKEDLRKMEVILEAELMRQRRSTAPNF